MALPLKRGGVYLLACSFGPDSMALLNMLDTEGYKPIVCHVNYHRRPESNLEQAGLEQYCLEHDLDLDVLDTADMKPEGNFQAWARNVRYRFFQKRYREYSADALLVAHQQDDHIETFLMQKDRKTRLFSYGLSSVTHSFGMVINRPLLDYSKASLKRYCDENKVPYSVDSSNLTDHYLRNRIRHSVVERMDAETRSELLAEIEELNSTISATIKKLKDNISDFGAVSIEIVKTLSNDSFAFLLYLMLQAKNCYLPLGKNRISQTHSLCLSEHPNASVSVGAQWIFERRYSFLVLTHAQKSEPYCYSLSEPGPLECPYFSVDFSGGYLKDHILLESYPLTIRPSKPGDQIRVGKIIKRINRLFIDWKLPLTLRKIWPIVVDKNGVPIYIPRFQKDSRFPSQSNFEIKKSFDYVE